MRTARQRFSAQAVLRAAPLFALLAIGCGGSGSTSKPTVVVAISPAAVSDLLVGETQVFNATATTAAGTDSRGVTWSVTEPVAGSWLSGRSSTTVLFTPLDIGTFHVVATSVTNTNVSVAATVGVVAPMSLPPHTFDVAPGAAIRLPGSGLPGVAWSVQEPDGGVVDQNGDYTAPERDGVYHIVVAGAADPRLNGVIEVTVRAI